MPLTEQRLERQTTAATLRRVYRNPPVGQATLEIGIRVPDDALLEVARAIQSPFLDRLQPILKEGTGDIEGYELGATTVPEELLRLRADSWSYQRLAPYPGWEAWTPHAFGHVRSFLSLGPPGDVNRLSVRYLNFIDLPMAVELSDYLLTAPVLPPGVPQKIASFFAQTLVRLEETDMYAVLRQGTMPMSNPGTVRIAVDVETLQRRQKGPVTADEAIEVFERLHEHEVDFFERCITNRTRELFD